MKIIEQDMLKLESGVLFHQVNAEGIMGGGIAADLAAKYPKLESQYRDFCEDECRTDEYGEKLLYTLLGSVYLFQVTPRLYIANVFGQSLSSNGTRLTNYEAVAKAFETAVDKLDINSYKLPLYFPYKMGCGLGGGEWSIYSAMIAHYFPNAIICKHNV